MPTKAPALTTFYKQVLESFGFEVVKGDLVSFRSPDTSGLKPTTVEGRRLVLPTKEVLDQGITDDLHAFHPVCENIARKGASPTMGLLQRTTKALVAYYVTTIADGLMEIICDPKAHKDLPPECTELLKATSEADSKSLKIFRDIMKRAATDGKIVNVYLKNGGVYEGDRVNRLAVMRFPVVQEIKRADEDKIFGIKVRKKDLKVLNGLFDYMLPNAEDVDTYSYGSNERVAPFFDALMRSWLSFARQINSILNKFTMLEPAPIPVGFNKHINRLGEFYREIPSLPGNEGAVSKGEVTETAPTKVPQEIPKNQTPSQKPHSGSQKGSDKMTVAELMEARKTPQTAPQSPSAPYPYPTQSQFGQPAQNTPPPWMQNQFQPQIQQNPFAGAFAGGRNPSPAGPGHAPMGMNGPNWGGGSSFGGNNNLL